MGGCLALEPVTGRTWTQAASPRPGLRQVAVLCCAVLLSGCAVLPGLGIDTSPDPRAVVAAERDDAQGLARGHVITFVEAARREERAADRVLGSDETEDDSLMLSYRLALAAEVDAGKVTPDEADRRAAGMAARLASADGPRRDAVRHELHALIPPPDRAFDPQTTAPAPRNVCLGMTFYGIVGTRCALGDR